LSTLSLQIVSDHSATSQMFFLVEWRPSSKIVDSVITLLLFPECQVLLEQLNDAFSVAEVILLELIDFVESLLESAISELACLVVVLENFIVEYREVKSETELDRVAGRKIDGVSLFVCGLCLLLNFCE